MTLAEFIESTDQRVGEIKEVSRLMRTAYSEALRLFDADENSGPAKKWHMRAFRRVSI